jgi:hypothetical protein
LVLDSQRPLGAHFIWERESECVFVWLLKRSLANQGALIVDGQAIDTT